MNMYHELKYPAVFSPEGDWSWGVRFPDVPAAQTFGKTVKEAADNAANALAVALFEQTPPRATDPQFLELGKGEFVAWIEAPQLNFGPDKSIHQKQAD